MRPAGIPTGIPADSLKWPEIKPKYLYFPCRPVWNKTSILALVRVAGSLSAVKYLAGKFGINASRVRPWDRPQAKFQQVIADIAAAGHSEAAAWLASQTASAQV